MSSRQFRHFGQTAAMGNAPGTNGFGTKMNIKYSSAGRSDEKFLSRKRFPWTKTAQVRAFCALFKTAAGSKILTTLSHGERTARFRQWSPRRKWKQGFDNKISSGRQKGEHCNTPTLWTQQEARFWQRNHPEEKETGFRHRYRPKEKSAKLRR